MDNFKVIYKILSTLEKAMDVPTFDVSVISYESLDIPKERWSKYMEMMVDAGYVKGVRISQDMTGSLHANCRDIRITLKGLEYLQENSMMQKMYGFAKGVKEIIPML